MHVLFRTLMVATAMLLASCVDGREEIWIARDGSGHASVDLQFPSSAAKLYGGIQGLERLLADLLANTEALHDTHHEVTTIDNRVHLHVTARFRSVMDLKEMASHLPSRNTLPPAASGFAGVVTLKTRGRHLDFSRTLSPAASLPGASLLPTTSWKGRLTYILHLPEPATTTNATRTEDANRTLIWEIPLAGLMRKPATLEFSAPIPIPFWVWPTLAASIALAATLAILRFRRRR